VLTRRNFLATSAASALVTTLARSHPRSAQAASSILVRRGPGIVDPDPHALAAAAVAAARAAGASYADVRLTETRTQLFWGAFPIPQEDSELIAVGVRVLMNGFWGFMSSALWTTDEVVRLARGAVAQAVTNAMGKTRPVDLGAVPRVDKGTWTMPVKYDPFDISIGEKLDFMKDAASYAESLMSVTGTAFEMHFRRQRQVFASSDGSSWEQTTFVASGGFTVWYRDQYSLGLNQGNVSAEFLSPAGKGWEHISESGLVDQIPGLVDLAEQARHVVPVEADAYDAVFSAQAVAALADATIGAASELDRALGYEADAGGTSYLSDPLGMLGTYKVGSALLDVTADRSTPGGAATIRWDDEAVVPDTFPIVTNGVLVDFQTTREQAAWLAPYYQKIGKPVRSHGCAGADSAMNITLQHAPNFRVLPGGTDVGFDDLVANVKKGIAVLHLETEMDQQQLNGTAYPLMREIKNGKLGRFIQFGCIAFRAPELWKKLVAIGGPSSERWYGFARGKGQPWQETTHSVGAVPARISDVRVFDVRFKA
jgi:TldD protein